MLLNEIINFVPRGQKKHSEIKYPNMLNKINWGADRPVQTSDVVVKSSDNRAVYGRRSIVQRT